MRIAAAFLLAIASVINMIAGAGCLILGVKGAGVLTGMLASMHSLMGDRAGEYFAVIESELDRAVVGLMALENKLEFALAKLTALGGSFGDALAVAGMLVMIAGVLVLAAAVQLLKARLGKIAYIGAGAAILADAAPLALLGFSYFQLPGIIGGLLGIFAARRFPAGVINRPAATPGAAGKPAAAAEPRVATKIRPTVRTASYPTPEPDAAPKASSRIAVFISAGVIVTGCALVAYLAYLKYFGPGAAEAPAQTAAPAPAPATTPAPGKNTIRTSALPAPETAATIPSGPVQGQLDGTPFNPERAVLMVTTSWTGGGNKTSLFGGTTGSRSFERLSLVLEAGKDLQVEITDLPVSYDFAKGLKLKIAAGPMKPGQPKLALTFPQSSDFPKTEFVSDRYDLILELKPLKGNRVDGRISFSLPANKKTQFAGNLKAWVYGHPDIEPDLLQGGRQTFRYLAFQYLKEIHPGSEIVIKDDTYSHQVGDASFLLRGHIMVVYTVDGNEAASMLRISTSEGYWRVLDSLDATYLAEAHPIEIPDSRNEGQWLNYLAATHTEEWFRETYPGKYPWSVSFTGNSNTEIGYADIHLRLQIYGETDAIKRRYYFRRKDGRWRYIRDLNEDEGIDLNTGDVIKIVNNS